MLFYDYAEQFHCHPQDVPRIVTLRAWERWRAREQARHARRAYEHSQRTDDWTELSGDERALMEWAAKDTDG